MKYVFTTILVLSLAYVLINCHLGSEKSVIEQLKKISDIKEARGTFGVYDIVAKVQCDRVEKLREIITWKIRKIPEIQATLTLMKIEGQGE